MGKIWKLLLAGVFFALTLNFVQSFKAEARDGKQVGRYQVSAWAHQTVGYNGIIGYVIIDTATGEVVSKWSGDLKDYRSQEQSSSVEE